MRIFFPVDCMSDVSALKEALRDDGHEFLSARPGTAVVQLMKRESPPEVLVLDASAPDMVAADVCRSLRQSTAEPRPYLVVLSGNGGTRQAVELLESGVDLLISRPVERDELLARVKAALRTAAYQAGLWKRLQSSAASPAMAPAVAATPVPETPPQAVVQPERVPVPSGGVLATVGPTLEQILTTLMPLAQLETMVGQTLTDMGLGDATPVTDPEVLAKFVPQIGIVHFMLMPDRSAWLDLLLETDHDSALNLYQTFTGMGAEEVADTDLVDVIGETLNMIQGALKATFKASGEELLVPLVPQSIPPDQVPGRVSHSTIHSRHLYQLEGVLLRFTLYTYFSPVQRKPLRELTVASVLAEPLRPVDNDELVLINKGTLLNDRAMKKVANLAEFAPRNQLHSVMEPSPLVGLLSMK